MKNVIFPHILSIFNKCDVCKINCAKYTYNVKSNIYIGVVSCNTVYCQDYLLNSVEKTTKSYESLYNKYGKWISIIRTNGTKDSGWTINGDAYQEKENEPFWVEVIKPSEKIKKIIDLESIIRIK